ncbi:hypothetical protein F7230_08350 [Corynebacterium sp. 320]|nr:hypothetical protein F7230_08350 [Corynebacterium sp. 320]KAB1551338.1 hypothetical protein F7233_07430 [Corynebacterium sp. 321]KAB1551833.1 hypothetical protein F7232_06840 [Corynebacterium sp. 319]KAB3526048.1 hypothetical protein F8354_08350 [Corynebacterium sp. 250]KAB3538828.1 hypothetical protein F8390_07420 [Corynebacterium sp. 366]
MKTPDAVSIRSFAVGGSLGYFTHKMFDENARFGPKSGVFVEQFVGGVPVGGARPAAQGCYINTVTTQPPRPENSRSQHAPGSQRTQHTEPHRRKPQRSKPQGWKSFLSPGWALALVLVIAFSYVAFTTLAPWQLGKNERNSANNQRLEQAFHQDPVPLTSVMKPGQDQVREDDDWTHVTLEGSYVPGQDVILRNRAVDGAVVFQILTPFKLSEAPGSAPESKPASTPTAPSTPHTIMVNRGFIAPGAGGTIPDIPPSPAGPTNISGFLKLDEDPGESSVATADGHKVVNTISASLNEQATGTQLIKGYVQADEQSVDKGLRPIPLPQLTSGPYLSYGIQWIAFGIIAPIILGWFVWSELKERRMEREERDELQASKGTVGEEKLASDIKEKDAQPAPIVEDSVEQKMRDRYGKSRSSRANRRNNNGERF